MGEFGVDVQEQICLFLNNVKVILEVVGISMDKVVKMIVFLKDMNDFVFVNEVYSIFFEQFYLVCSVVEVVCLLKDVFVEIEVIVLKQNGCFF